MDPEAKNTNDFSLLPYHTALKAELDFLKSLANAGMKFGDPKLRNDRPRLPPSVLTPSWSSSCERWASMHRM